MKAIYLGWAVSRIGAGTYHEWDEETPDRIEILGNTQNLTLRDPRGGRREEVTVLCRFKSPASHFPESGYQNYLAVEIEYRDPDYDGGYSSRILLDCRVEESVHIPPRGHDTRRLRISYGAAMPAQPSSSSYILKGWNSEWFRKMEYGRLPEFHYPDPKIAERMDYNRWSRLAFGASSDFASGVHISDGSTGVSFRPTDHGLEINGLELSWFGLERLVTALARQFFFRGQESGYHYKQVAQPNQSLLISIPTDAAMFCHPLGYLEACQTPYGAGYAVQAYNVYMVGRHEGTPGHRILSFTADEKDDADIHVKWRFRDLLQFEFLNRTNESANIRIGIF